MVQHLILEPACEKALERLIEEPSKCLSGLVAEWRGNRIVLHFERDMQPLASREVAASGKGVAPIPAQEVAPRHSPRRRPMDWYSLGILSLMLTSAAAAMASLLSAVSP